MAETTKANPYVYANDDPVNEVDPNGRESFSQWWNATGQCIASAVVAPLEGLGVAIASLGAIAGGIYVLAAVTAPAWVTWIILIGGAIALGAVAGCAAFATFGYHYN